VSTDDLITSGVCENLSEVLDMFPLELLDDFCEPTTGGCGSVPARRTGGCYEV
jgi:hypothetical protein